MEWISIDEATKIARKSKRTLQRYLEKMPNAKRSKLTKKIKDGEGGNAVLHLHKKLLKEWGYNVLDKNAPEPQEGSSNTQTNLPFINYEKALEEKQEQIDFLKGELETKNGQLEKSHQEKLIIMERLRESNILLGNLQQEVKKLGSGNSKDEDQNNSHVVAKPPKTIEALWLIVVILLLTAVIVGVFLGV